MIVSLNLRVAIDPDVKMRGETETHSTNSCSLKVKRADFANELAMYAPQRAWLSLEAPKLSSEVAKLCPLRLRSPHIAVVEIVHEVAFER